MLAYCALTPVSPLSVGVGFIETLGAIYTGPDAMHGISDLAGGLEPFVSGGIVDRLGQTGFRPGSTTGVPKWIVDGTVNLTSGAFTIGAKWVIKEESSSLDEGPGNITDRGRFWGFTAEYGRPIGAWSVDVRFRYAQGEIDYRSSADDGCSPA